MVGFRGITPREAQPTLRSIEAGAIGWVVLFDVDAETGGPRNIQSPGQLQELNLALKAAGSIPIMVTVDAEGGFYHRLKERYGFAPAVPAATIGETNDLAFTHGAGLSVATELARAGIDMNLSPVVDLLNHANLTVSARRRSFSADPEIVVAHAREMILAHHEAGVLTAVKHFPGMGGALKPFAPGVGEIIQSWSTDELLPYRLLQAEGLMDAVLATRATHPEIDEELPGCLSPKVIDGILRTDIGYEGVVVSDALEMLPIWDIFGFERGVVKAIQAGCDVLLFCNESGIVPYSDDRASAAIDVVVDAIERGELTEARIDESCRRILALKARRENLAASRK
jgi:beta-N-acetylhexosaminidase